MKNGKLAIMLSLLFLLPALSKALELDNSYTIVEQNNKKGLINNQGEVVIPAKYDDIGWSKGKLQIIKNVVGFKRNNSWGLINTKNKIVHEPVFFSLYPADNFIIASKVGKYNNLLQYGLLNNKGKVLIAFKYANIEPHDDYLIASYKNEKQERFGLITWKDKILLPFRYQEITPLSESSFALKDFTGKIAYYDSKKNDITELSSDSIIYINAKHAIISVAGRKGMVNDEGQVMIRPHYKRLQLNNDNSVNALPYPQWAMVNIDHKSFHQYQYEKMFPLGDDLLKATLSGYEALIKSDGQQIRELQGIAIGNFADNIAIISNGQKKGIMASNGEILLEAIYDSIHVMDDYFLVGKKRIQKTDWFIINRATNEIISTPPFHEVKPLSDDFFAARLDRYWALVNDQGKTVTSFKFKNVEPTIDGNAQVTLIKQEGIMDQEGNWLVVPRSGKLIYINQDFYVSASGFCRFLMYRKGREYYCTQDSLLKREHDIMEISRDGKKGLFDLTGNRLLNTRYNFISELQSDSIYTFRKEGRYGIMTKNGKILTEDRNFEELYEMSEGFIGVKINGAYGFVDANGDLRIANRYDAILPFSEGFAGIKLLGRWGFVNKLERLKIQPLYQQVSPFNNDMALVKRNDQWGIINKEGKEVLHTAYDSLQKLDNGRYISKKNNKYGLISEEGREMVFPKYDNIADLKNGYVKVERNGKFGVCNLDGVIEIPIIYQEIKYDSHNDKYLVKSSPEWETIELEE